MIKFHVQTPRISLNPPVYYCPRAKGAFVLDGNIHKPFWENVPFTAPFADISGYDFPTPRFQTRAKLCWDDKNLYIAALLEGPEIWANIRKRDSVMYYDNDFEVFLDPSSSTHNYMELEMNALNTQWDLMLTHPYRDGGRSVTGWDMKGLETAVHIEGTVNDPAADNRFWSAEIRIPFQGLMETYSLEENPPELERCYDLSVFLEISPETQRRRVLERNGPEWGQRFFERWIPLENTYHEATRTAERCTLRLEEEP